MSDGRPEAGHVPVRPSWRCAACGDTPWPCPPAQHTLLRDYRDARLSLSIYLAGCMIDAIDDELPDDRPGGLAERFLHWTRRLSPPATAPRSDASRPADP